MAMNMEKLSRLMKLSGDIQKKKRSTRAKALEQAWAIVNNADITVFYLVQKLNRHKDMDGKVQQKVREQYTLFNS
jgi:hypothetical protein